MTRSPTAVGAPARWTPDTNRFQAPAATAPGATPDRRPVAELVGVSKHYGSVAALTDVSIAAREGEVLAVLGPNGAGKTTAVSLMLGLLRASAGQVRLFGSDPRSPRNRMRVGAMLQVSGVPATLTVREHLTAFASYYPAPLGVEETIALAGLEGVANRLYGKLSGGQQQGLHFALAMVGNPDLLFLDEPTTGLDVASRRAFWSSVREFLGGRRTVVLTTHYLEEADALADRVVVLGGGKVLAEGTPDQIKGRAALRRVRVTSGLTLAAARTLPGVRKADRAGVNLTLLTADADATVRALLAADPAAAGLEVTGAALEDAFLTLTADHEGPNGRTEA
ncbi:MAG: ABC transporter ATP-binding protein [Trueperaceae bacterium]|nr:ABC transporter ATP-binding protein [Trueperaceae bacterium]